MCSSSGSAQALVWVPGPGTAASNTSEGAGRPATDEVLIQPEGVDVTRDGGFLVADNGNSRILKVSSAGIATVVAGTGVAGYSGDGGPATKAQIMMPQGVEVLPGGGFLIAESVGSRIRKVSRKGIITTVAGTNLPGYSGDGGPATAAQLLGPEDVSRMPDGGFVIADTFNNRIRRVWPNGTITTVAGTGTAGYSGDGGPASLAQINRPEGVAVTRHGSILITDGLNHRIRRISSRTGIITTIAGTGTRGYSGDGGPASAAELYIPEKITATRDGGYLISDTCNHALREVSRKGIITTIAGKGRPGYSGDGGTAAAAKIHGPQGEAKIPGGGYLIVDSANNVVRRVSPSGVMSTVAGTGLEWSSPEDGPDVTEELCLNQLTVLAGQTVSQLGG